MNLLQVRTKFRELSGRFDLVNADYSDNGADFFINEGRKVLDRLDETQKSWASAFRFIEIGGFAVHFQHCRAIKEVWMSTTTARWQLEKMRLQEMIAEYLTGMPSSRDVGSPLYYSPNITRISPQDAIPSDIEGFIGFIDVSAGNAHGYNTILVNVPVEEKVMVEIKGLFYSMELVNDTDENFWSSQHPLLLYFAAMYCIEITNRNTQGANDWMGQILVFMKQLGMDLVEEVIAEVTQIRD